MKKIIVYVMFFLGSFLIYSQDNFFDDIDKLNYDGNFADAKILLKEKFTENKNDIKIAWHLAQVNFFISEITDKRLVRVDLFSESVKITEPFLNSTDAEKNDLVNLTFWYAANYALKIRDTGLLYEKSGAGLIAKVLKLSDKCTEIDPEFTLAYALKGKFYGAVPAFLGGNKIKMEINYVLALKYATEYERSSILYDIVNSLVVRKWTLDTKILEAKKQKTDLSILLSADKDDATLVNEYTKEIIDSLNARENISFREMNILKDINTLLEKNAPKNL